MQVRGSIARAAQVDEAGPAARLVAAEDARVALQPLAQGAGLGLDVGGALAGVGAAQVAAQAAQGARPPGGVVAGQVDVDDAVAVRAAPLQQRHGPGDRADVPAEALQRLLRRNAAAAAVPRVGLARALQRQRLGRAVDRGGPPARRARRLADQFVRLAPPVGISKVRIFPSSSGRPPRTTQVADGVGGQAEADLQGGRRPARSTADRPASPPFCSR